MQYSIPVVFLKGKVTLNVISRKRKHAYWFFDKNIVTTHTACSRFPKDPKPQKDQQSLSFMNFQYVRRTRSIIRKCTIPFLTK
jgi:hypothetical protein